MPLMPQIICPRCGEKVTLPWYWIAGVEAIVRCRGCKMPMKTGYKTGALLSALALVASILTCQLMVWLLSPYTLLLTLIILPTLWIYLSYRMRRLWMILSAKRYAKGHPLPSSPESEPTEHPFSEGVNPLASPEANTPPATHSQHSPHSPHEEESPLPSSASTPPRRSSLPRDVWFSEQEYEEEYEED